MRIEYDHMFVGITRAEFAKQQQLKGAPKREHGGYAWYGPNYGIDGQFACTLYVWQGKEGAKGIGFVKEAHQGE